MWCKVWHKFVVGVLFMAQLLSASAQATESAERVVALASIEPVAQVLRELFQELPHVQVETLLLPHQNPHHAALTPGQARRVLKSDVVVWLGGEAEPHIADIIRKHGRLQVALAAQEGALLLNEQDDHHHTHESHLDPHLWLAPQNIKALVKGLEAHKAVFQLTPEAWQQVESQFLQRLQGAEAQVAEQLAPYQEAGYLSHHDAWGYFAISFDLQRPLVVATNIDSEASSRRVVELRQQMQQQHIQCVVAEPEARKGLLRRLCTGDCVLYEVDPLGRHLSEANYTEFLQQLGQQFSACFAGEKQN